MIQNQHMGERMAATGAGRLPPGQRARREAFLPNKAIFEKQTHFGAVPARRIARAERCHGKTGGWAFRDRCDHHKRLMPIAGEPGLQC